MKKEMNNYDMSPLYKKSEKIMKKEMNSYDMSPLYKKSEKIKNMHVYACVDIKYF